MINNRLPIIPAALARQHQIHNVTDDRFRACARLLQVLWRKDQQLPIGDYVIAEGVVQPLGSRIAEGMTSGRNFLTPAIAQLAWLEMIYREPGAVIEEQRLWENLLSSQALVFNLFGPLRLNLEHATAFLRAMCPDLADAEATAVLFEHSPGRGDPELTGDYTAFDALIAYKRASERTGFVAIEVKYSESCQETQKPMRPSCQAAMVTSALYTFAGAPELQAAPLQQFTREHVLAQMAMMRGKYQEGRFVVVAPAANQAVQAACKAYEAQLSEPTDAHVGFETWTLDNVVNVMRQHVDAAYAEAFHRRYLDWDRVAAALDTTRPPMPEIKRLADRRKR
ncbi:hypothetical protein HY78_02180 [Rhizorhabdus wittichii DC-6]|nr:hypothetical protein HY78_02180 [Rhizorhabdus wittichii DC-6]